MNYGQKEVMEEAVVRKIGVISLANMFGLMYALMGLLLGIFFLIISFTSLSTLFNSLGLGSYGFLSIIIFPIGYGIAGWLSGAMFGLFYNWSAKLGKGVKLYSD